MKLQRKNKFLGIVGTGLLITSLATGGYVIFQNYQSENAYSNLEQIALVKENKNVNDIPNVETLENKTEELPEETPKTVTPKYDFNLLKEINPDITGYLEGSSLIMPYPVVKTTDTAYYLSHTADKKPSILGSICMDANADMTNSVTIIYGHNTLDGSMFGNLNNYKNVDYMNNNPVFTYYDETGVYEFDVFANIVDDDIQTRFSSPEDYNHYLNTIKSNSIASRPVDVDSDDHIVFLYDCLEDFEKTSPNDPNRNLIVAKVNKVLDYELTETKTK